ncbi:hypothetical protein Thiowin_01821 [Thiorhodovibrio winogradskyi]|uniref:Uncharacterized protein n=1 Tax=Thiorhodovibrio winogradskyi TaxID=77007 RepID=A0ABZ0S8I5_9GAMM
MSKNLIKPQVFLLALFLVGVSAAALAEARGWRPSA